MVLCYHDVPSRTMFQAQLVVLEHRAALSGRFPGALLLYWKLRLRMSS